MGSDTDQTEAPGPYSRVLLKISGEALMGSLAYGIDPEMVDRVAGEIESVHSLGIEVCLVIGGGNIFRGVSSAASGMERATGDYMRSEEHTSELQSLMRISYAVFCLKKKITNDTQQNTNTI